MQKAALASVLVVLSALLLLVRVQLYVQNEHAQNLLPLVGERVVVGKVADDPERRASNVHAEIAVKSVDGTPREGKLLAILNRDEPLAYGDKVTLRGKIEKPEAFETSTGRLFDYQSYLEVQGISALMRYGTVLGREPGNFSAQGFLFTLKHYYEYSIERLFPEPDGSLLEGILLGERRGIPQELTDAFIASSLVHVLVLSGHNITIVSEAVFRALGFLPRSFQYGTGALLMVLFAAMTGFSATTVRALVMALIALLARYQHRSALALRSLVVAAALMILWNPPIVLHDQSFILSVLATFGLITLAPWVEQTLWRIPNYRRFDLRSILATTIAVEIFVTPALLYFSGIFGVYALPANILVLPVVPFAMLFGFIAGVVGVVSPTLALPAMLLCDVLLKWMMFVATTASLLPFAKIIAAPFSAWLLLALYVPLTACAIWLHLRTSSR